jgi:thiamine transport system substrate-binding protein
MSTRTALTPGGAGGRVLLAAATVLSLAALSACSVAGRSGGAETDGDRVVLVTHDSFAVSDEVLAAFQEETGRTVEVRQVGDAGAMVNQLVLTKDEPLGDVVFGIDNTFASRALDEGVLDAYESPAVGPEIAALAPDDSGRLTPVDYSDVCVNVDHAWFAEAGRPEPKTLEDLADPQYANLLVVEDPASSSPGLAFLLATVGAFGPQGWEQYWSALRANGVKVASGWEDAYYVDFSGPSSEGDRPLVVSYATSPPYEVPEGSDTAPTGALLDTCFRQVEYAGVLAGGDNPEGARELVDFLLSETFQSDIPEQMYVYPASPDAELPAEWEAFAPLAPDPFEVDPDEIAENRQAWIERWTDIVIG